MTTGTADFLQKRIEKYTQFSFTMMHNMQTTAVYYESTKKRSIFAAGSSYSIMKSYLPIPDKGFVVMQYIPVAKDTEKVFVQKLDESFDSFTLATGLIAARVLQTKKRDTFQIMMIWKSEADFEIWKKSKSTQTDFTTLVRKPTYFVERAFTQTYHIMEDPLQTQ